MSVPALMQKTGLSRGFFYKNPIVRGEIDAAMEQQAGMVDPRRNIISQAMEAEMNLLRQQLQKLKSENENLIKENQKLKKDTIQERVESYQTDLSYIIMQSRSARIQQICFAL